MHKRIEHKLRIKYGLVDYPSSTQVKDWLARADALAKAGADLERAGRQAALEVFGDVDQILLFSEADTIEALLARAQAESAMSILGPKIRIKYKLVEVPNDEQVDKWAELSEKFIGEGMDAEEAGRSAAHTLFEFDDNLILKAEADTIESLLNQAKKK